MIKIQMLLHKADGVGAAERVGWDRGGRGQGTPSFSSLTN